MIYTVGHTASYEQYFQEQTTPKKLGRTDDYPGGSVWMTKEAAQKHCNKEYSVYGVIADWHTDTAPSHDGDWHDLLVTSVLVKV